MLDQFTYNTKKYIKYYFNPLLDKLFQQPNLLATRDSQCQTSGRVCRAITHWFPLDQGSLQLGSNWIPLHGLLGDTQGVVLFIYKASKVQIQDSVNTYYIFVEYQVSNNQILVTTECQILQQISSCTVYMPSRANQEQAASKGISRQLSLEESSEHGQLWDINDPCVQCIHHRIGKMIFVDCQPFSQEPITRLWAPSSRLCRMFPCLLK